ncbi:hypothetical protein BDV95DRAFT_479273 [Massariosphaeria phaeospora]|uniref:MARVEL domain-containing protein n=1 Tax=Massariosphaeria phaeospora TaxID=100035 RepID=A0A7C8IRS7_9PLEO|nr:hypothetical protein BDV95DRAFT_479273 [Massariosphaeria phaeospora]
MAVNWVLAVRGVQVVLSVVVLGLMGYVVSSWWTAHWRQSSPTEINFMVATPVWSILALPVLAIVPWKIPRTTETMVAKIAFLVLEWITMLFWMGGFIALALFLNDRICFGTVCNIAKAATVISAIQWAAWAATASWGMFFFFRVAMKGGVRKLDRKVEMHQGV